MDTDLTSTQQQLAACRLRRADACYRTSRRSTGRNEGKRIIGTGARDWRALVPLLNETKKAIVAVMGELGRPVSSSELQRIWPEPKSLSLFEYHLSTLVKARIATLAVDSGELRFCLDENFFLTIHPLSKSG